MKTKLYQINPTFARYNKLPVYFIAYQLAETNKAIYLYGHGTTSTKNKGVCSVCGRELTHPVSVELGVGPECGKHHWDWDEVGGYTKENVQKLTKVVEQRLQIDQWLPRSVIYETSEAGESVAVPEDHKMLNQEQKDKPTNRVAEYDKDKDRIKIVFPFDRDLINQIKTIPGRKYHKKPQPHWTCPPSTQALEKLLATGFSIGKDLSDLMEELITQKAEILKPSTDIEIPGLGGTLYPFQAQGVNFIDARNGRALIGDEMRLGKSIQTLAWLQLRQNIRPVVLVVPAAVKYDWRNKALEWMDSPNVQVLEGQTPYPITGELVIINYHILQYWVKELIEFGPEVLVVDEIQRIKNKQAKRTKACLKLGKKTKHVIGLSGTFIKNRPEEGFNAIQLIDRSIFPNKWHYLHRYCDAKHNGFGWDFSGASNTKELHDILSNSIMLRRRLKDVKDNLPEKTKTFVPMEIDNDKEYAKAENDFINWIKGKVEKDMHTELREKLGDELFKNIKINKEQLERMKMDKAVKAESAQALVQLQALEQLAAQGKIKSVVSWISDFLESGEKLVVMAVNKFVVRQLMEAFPKIAVKIDGDLSADQKTETEQIFQTNPKIRLMIGNIQAASEGMDFSASNTVAVVQLPWSPGDLEQALKRIENINKDGVPLFHYYLLAKDTIEERKANILDKKQKVLDSVLDGKDTEDESLLTELMNQYKQD